MLDMRLLYHKLCAPAPDEYINMWNALYKTKQKGLAVAAKFILDLYEPDSVQFNDEKINFGQEIWKKLKPISKKDVVKMCFGEVPK